MAERLRERSYLADRGLATVLTIVTSLRKPLLLEGEAGVGKTECAKALADVLGARLIRLQCYEGIDVAHALYDWNYARQMLYIRTLEAAEAAQPDAVDDVFGRRFLVRRPLLDAIDNADERPPLPGAPPVARRNRQRGRAPAGPPDRRDRSRRRRVRGVPARAAVGLPG